MRSLLPLPCLFLAVLLTAGSAVQAQTELPDRLPEEARRLDSEEIKALLGSGPFQFVGAEGKARGTSIWDLGTGTAHGSFVWEGRLKGSWTLAWFVEEDLSCLKPSQGPAVCREIHAHGKGFFEVNLDGGIHTLTTPLPLPPLERPMTADEAAALYPPFIAWAQGLHGTVQGAEESDGVITLEVATGEGPAQSLRIDAANGAVLGGNPAPR